MDVELYPNPFVEPIKNSLFVQYDLASTREQLRIIITMPRNYE